MSEPKIYWEDVESGTVSIYGPRLVTREEIVAFAAEFDPQPMHLDEAAASATALGGLGASGWHTCCLLMRMIADGFLLNASSMGAPGVDEVRWLKPLRPGTRIRIRSTVLDKRASNSRPARSSSVDWQGPWLWPGSGNTLVTVWRGIARVYTIAAWVARRAGGIEKGSDPKYPTPVMGQCITEPPSTTMVCPVRKSLSEEAR